jgi:hypothetical protein
MDEKEEFYRISGLQDFKNKTHITIINGDEQPTEGILILEYVQFFLI